jgi:hypothetical protein
MRRSFQQRPPNPPWLTRRQPVAQVQIMNTISGRLRAALVAGKIPVSDGNLTALCGGLNTIGHRYRIEKAVRNAKTDIELKTDLSRLYAACCTVVDVLDADLSGSCQIEAMVADPWRGSQVPRLVEELRSLLPGLEMALAMARQNGMPKKRQQDPETVFFLMVHDLCRKLIGDHEPGIAGPLHRFTRHCAALVDAGIIVPESENSFQKRLNAALARRQEKPAFFPK